MFHDQLPLFVSLFSDFPESIANSTLDDLPNSLYNPTSPSSDLRKPNDLHPYSTVTFDLDHHHSNNFVKQQQSHGTTPSLANGFFDGTHIVMANHMTKLAGMSSASGLLGALPRWPSGLEAVAIDNIHSMQTVENSVPYSICENNFISPQSCSYVSIAQKGPSQNKFSMVAGQPGNSSVAMVTSDQKACDNSNKHDKANRRVPKSGNTSRYGNVNVVDLMQDLERADALSGSTNVEVTSAQTNAANTYQQSIAGEVKMSYSRVLQEPKKATIPPPPMSGKSQTGDLDLSTGLSARGQGHGQVQGQQGVKGESSTMQSETISELHDLLVKSQNQGISDNNNNDGDVKKKRRRRRRRKKKSGDGDTADNDDPNSGANEEITLHFEDEEEFPDLGFGAGGLEDGKSGNHDNAAFISYSEIVKHNVSMDSWLIYEC